MKLKSFSIFVALSLVSVVCWADLSSLEKGVGVTTENFSQLVSTEPALSVARSVHREHDAGFVYGFLRTDGDIVYSISREPRLYAGKFSNRSVTGHWPLTRWRGELTEENRSIYALHGRDWSAEESYHQYRQNLGPGGRRTPRFGCFHRNPLRYGDIEGDGQQEVVLFLGNGRQAIFMGSLDMVVFSPKREEVVFSARLVHADVGDEVIPEEHPDQPDLEERSQFMSYIQHWGGINTTGMQAYAKVYMLDDLVEVEDGEDPVHDVLVWRKRFESLPIGDSRSGFDLAAEGLDHFRRVDGEYQLQNTPDEQIQAWLSERDLTWPKGYPNYSECEGEEGQLIPEMHDPLLNDPDVLEGVDPETMTFIEAGAG